MPATPHVEKHFAAAEAVRDVVIGMSDGLTVPFALAGSSRPVETSSSQLSALSFQLPHPPNGNGRQCGALGSVQSLTQSCGLARPWRLSPGLRSSNSATDR